MKRLNLSLRSCIFFMLLIGGAMGFVVRLKACFPVKVPESNELAPHDASSNGKFIVAAYVSESTFDPVEILARLWIFDIDAWRWRKYSTAKRPIGKATFLGESKRLLLNMNDGSWWIFDMDSMELRQVTEERKFSSIAISAAAKVFAMASEDGFIEVYDYEGEKVSRSIMVDDARIDQVMLSHDGKSILVVTKSDSKINIPREGHQDPGIQLRIYNVQTGEYIRNVDVFSPRSGLYSAAFLSNLQIAFLDPKGMVCETLAKPNSHIRVLSSKTAHWICSSADGQVLLFGGDKSFWKMDVKANTLSRRFDAYIDGRMRLSPLGDLLAYESNNEMGSRDIVVHNTETGEILLKTQGCLPWWLGNTTLVWLGPEAVFAKKIILAKVEWYAWPETWILASAILLFFFRPIKNFCKMLGSVFLSRSINKLIRRLSLEK